MVVIARELLLYFHNMFSMLVTAFVSVASLSADCDTGWNKWSVSYETHTVSYY